MHLPFVPDRLRPPYKIGMFWRFFLLMFLSSCIVTGLFMVVANYIEVNRLEARIGAPSLEARIREKFTVMLPVLEQADGYPTLCEHVLRSLAFDVFAGPVLAKDGPNTLPKMVAATRFSMVYRRRQQVVCSYPARLQAPADKSGASRFTVREEDGGLHLDALIRSAATPDAALQTTLHIVGPRAALKKGDEFSWNLMFLFIGVLNLACAFSLVPLLVKRIRRAQAAARLWADGDINARIIDFQRDEFGALTRSFNHLANSFSEVIKIKQDLAASNERNKLARDLHDTAKQRAFALNLHLTALKSIGSSNPQESLKIATTALVLVQNLQSDLSSVIKRLSASTIAEIGIRRVLAGEFATLLDRSTLRWRLDVPDNIDSDLQGFPQFTQQVFLIAIEAATNALKHAGAHTVAIALAREGRVYRLAIEDDGIGIDAGALDRTGMGLANMRLRANSLPDGTFDLAPGTAGAGTRVLVTFTLEMKQP